MGSKWDKVFGLEHPEAYGKMEPEEDKATYIFNLDLESFNHDMLLVICQHLKIDIQHLHNKYGKTKREQCESHGIKYKP